MSTSPTRSAARSPPARARCWWSMPARVSRRRPWPTPITRSRPTTRSSRSSTRSTCRRPTPSACRKEIEDVIGIDTSDAVRVSAKTGLGIDELLEAMVKRLPPPKGDRNAPLKALLVDSWYDPYLGVVTLVRVQDGVLKKGMRIRMMAAARVLRPRQGRHLRAQGDRRGRARPGRDRLHHRRHQDHRRLQGRRHHHRRPQARDRDAGRLQALGAGGVLRPVPGRRRRVRDAARIARASSG